MTLTAGSCVERRTPRQVPSQRRLCFIAPLEISHSVDISTTFFHANTNSSPFACDFGRDTIIKKNTERESLGCEERERSFVGQRSGFYSFSKYKGSDLKHG